MLSYIVNDSIYIVLCSDSLVYLIHFLSLYAKRCKALLIRSNSEIELLPATIHPAIRLFRGRHEIHTP